MKKLYYEEGKLTLLQVNLLLNDLFINEMNMCIKSECEGIIALTIQEYQLYEKEVEGSKNNENIEKK